MSRDSLPSRLMPLASRLGVVPLYGDIHNHCNISYGHGSLTGALERARLQLDFVSITGHAAWPDMPVDDPSVAHIVDFHVKGFAKLKAGWLDHFNTLATYDAPGAFTVFPGYEIHSAAHGDYTIVYADLEPQPFELADDPAGLKAALAKAKGDRAFGYPHHIGYRLGARGINWSSFDAELSPFVEMFSMHGCAENSLTDRPYLHSMGPLNGSSTMQAGLAGGHVFGIVGSTDHHSGFPGSYGHGRLAVYTQSNDRDAIWSGMRGRHTNALTGDSIHLLTAISGIVQGGIVSPADEAELQIEAVGGGFIDAIDIMRNGALFERVTPALDPRPISSDSDGVFDTILFLELGWGARGSAHAWTGRISVSGGDITGVEPRLRGDEIVSPLEGDHSGHAVPSVSRSGPEVVFAVTATANPNNLTPATQGIAVHMRVGETSEIRVDLDGRALTIPVSRLLSGSISGNLGPIDSPAYRFHQLPRPSQWQWQGTVPLGRTEPGENFYVRLRQSGGQMAWTSPIFVRNDA